MYPYFYKNEKDLGNISSITCLLCISKFITDKDGIRYSELRCLLCGEVISAMKLKNEYKKYYLDSQKFKIHLDTNHNNCGDFILSHYSSVKSLLIENENELKTVVTYDIGRYFQKSRVLDSTIVSETSDMDESEDEEGMIIESDSIVERGSINSYQTVSIDMTKKVLRLILNGLPLTWDQRDGNSLGSINKKDIIKEIWDGILPSYYLSDKYIPILYNNTKYFVKQHVKNLKHYSLSCDGYSVPSKNIKVMVVFLHEYHNNTFSSILLDVVEMKSNSDTKAVMDKNGNEFELTDTDPIITADCTKCNTCAFKDKHHGCWSHRFNTAFAHMVKANVKSGNTKVCHGLKDNERELVDDFFSSVGRILKRVKGKTYTEFKSFYEKHVKKIIPTNSLNLRQPPTESPTRWLGIIPLLEWLRDFGIMLFFFTMTEKCEIDHLKLKDVLLQLPSVCKEMLIIERAMNILMVDDKPTIHLVLPITTKLKEILKNHKETLTGANERIAKLIATNYHNELNQGCLSISENMSDIYHIALFLYPDAYNLTKDQDLVNKCNEIAINEFLRRAHLYGLSDTDEDLKRFYMKRVDGCHDGNRENTSGNVFANLMSVDYQLKGTFDAVEDILHLSTINGLSDLYTKISYTERRLNHYMINLNQIEKQNTKKQEKN